MNRGLVVRQRWSVSALILLRLTLAALVLLPLAVTLGEALVHSWLPAYRMVFQWVAGDFQLLSLIIDHEGADRVLRATVTWKRIVLIGNHVIYPDPRGTANASTLLAHALQGPIVAIFATIAWPMHKGLSAGAKLWVEWAWRAILLLPLLTVLILIDMPMVLVGELWDMVIDADALDPGSTSALVVWKSFLQGGGRYALGLAISVLAVQAARRMTQLAGIASTSLTSVA